MSAVDCTDEVHPEVARRPSLAARVVGLDIAGIDVVARTSAGRSQAQGGAHCRGQCRAGPADAPEAGSQGSPRPVGRAICDHLFADDDTGRIPIVGVAGSQGTPPCIARLVAWLIHLQRRYMSAWPAATACSWNRRRVDAGDCARWASRRIAC